LSASVPLLGLTGAGSALRTWNLFVPLWRTTRPGGVTRRGQDDAARARVHGSRRPRFSLRFVGPRLAPRQTFPACHGMSSPSLRVIDAAFFVVIGRRRGAETLPARRHPHKGVRDHPRSGSAAPLTPAFAPPPPPASRRANQGD
jgi:hypothetical protein